eukprot:NODE_2009_length_1538_cov_39.423322_g1912_i0.p1 GENE.NODE_2009_length_1538_cov_39.423322_g1912_i0~~NODE_2009_length_1538_cov_39.423322_g1912_i0.p1  ORF type:complete len:429 (+),score=35.87 NODE_2009_length_1538_cov_39.423322_g1912_i0:55-1341(+)
MSVQGALLESPDEWVVYDGHGGPGQPSNFVVPSLLRLCLSSCLEMYPIFLTAYAIYSTQAPGLLNWTVTQLMYDNTDQNQVLMYTVLSIIAIVAPLFMATFVSTMAITTFYKQVWYYWLLKEGSYILDFDDKVYWKTKPFFVNLVFFIICGGMMFHLDTNLTRNPTVGGWVTFSTVLFSFAAYFTLSNGLSNFERHLVTLGEAYHPRNLGIASKLTLLSEKQLQCMFHRFNAAIPSAAKDPEAYKAYNDNPPSQAEVVASLEQLRQECQAADHEHVVQPAKDTVDQGRVLQHGGKPSFQYATTSLPYFAQAVKFQRVMTYSIVVVLVAIEIGGLAGGFFNDFGCRPLVLSPHVEVQCNGTLKKQGELTCTTGFTNDWGGPGIVWSSGTTCALACAPGYRSTRSNYTLSLYCDGGTWDNLARFNCEQNV